MNVSCPTCRAVYRVDPAKVPAGGVRARCSVCAGIMRVGMEPEPAPSAPDVAPATAAPAAPQRTIEAAPPEVTQPAPVRAATEQAPPAPAMPRPVQAPVMRPPARPATPPESRPQAPAPFPPVSSPFASPPGPATAPPSSPAAPPPVTGPSAPAGRAGVERPVSLPEAAPPARPPDPPVAPAPRPRPVNPFLSQDPAVKARRLARALISDLVVYHPAKRRDGLRDGSLKILFEEEIRKSWEEYTDQVGVELASRTPYFTEALNEILADGQPVF